jgi:hypothetical protein
MSYVEVIDNFRWQTSKIPIPGGTVLEFCIEKFIRLDQMSLPVV